MAGALPRLNLHFTPTSSSWLTLVNGTVVRRVGQPLAPPLRHRSVTELEAGIRKWVNEWNADPKPFVRAKTADEILENLAAYCQRISDSGH
jgi:hypothetical protein